MATASELDRCVPDTWLAHQKSLPDLPVPEIAASLKLFFECVAPLVSEDDLAEAKRCAAALEAGGEAAELQDRLLAYDASRKGQASFIESFWTSAYLTPDDSVVLNVNPFFILEEDPTPQGKSQIDRAASLVFSSLKFINVMRAGKLAATVWRGTPLCMSQVCGSLFGCARVPQEGSDFIRKAPLSAARHVVVLCQSQFYSFNVLGDDDTVLMDEDDIARILASIVRDASATGARESAMARAIGIMTAHSRANWAGVRASLEAVPRNREILSRIDAALFVLCLDDVAPTTIDEIAANALHGTYAVNDDGAQIGTCLNRWFDKLQIIVCENGAASMNFEHTAVDGHTVLRFAADTFADTVVRFARRCIAGSATVPDFLPATVSSAASEAKAARSAARAASKDGASGQPAAKMSKPGPAIERVARKLEWKLGPGEIDAIRYAEANVSDLITQNEVIVLEFEDYGKQFIVRNNLSPDAFVQVAMAYAHAALWGDMPSMYEPVLMKRFRHGRTEASRSVSFVSRHKNWDDAFVLSLELARNAS
jgi:carnitine O-acetyltransferase